MADPFRYPSPIEGCDCIICTRAGVDPTTYREPESPFAMYRLVSLDHSNTPHAMSHAEIAEFESRYPKHAEWTQPDSYLIRNTLWYKVCFKLIKNLLRDKDSKPFRDPVDWITYNLPDYPQHIRHPMDLGTIDRRLTADPCEYTNPDDFISDVRMVFRNCFVYNPPTDPVWRLAEGLSKKFEEQLASYAVMLH